MVYVPTKFSLKTANVGKCAIDGFYDDSKVLLSSSQGKHSQIPAKIASVSGHFHHPSLAKPSFTKNDVQTLLWYLKFEARWNKQNIWWRRTTHQGTIISHLGKRNIIVKTALVGDKLIPSRVYIYIYIKYQMLTLKHKQTCGVNNWNTPNMTIVSHFHKPMSTQCLVHL